MTTAGVPQLYMCVSSKVTTKHAFGALNFSSETDLGHAENKQSELCLSYNRGGLQIVGMGSLAIN